MNLLDTSLLSPRAIRRLAFPNGNAEARRAERSSAAKPGRRPQPPAEELDEPEWNSLPASPPLSPSTEPASEWLCWAFCLCTAIVALPLVGSRFVLPGAALAAEPCGEVLLWALPVVVALPFLLLACVRELVFRRDSRTPGAIAGFALGLLLGLAALPSWLG